MAFCPQNLRIVACAGNFTLWHYNSEDKRNEILQNNYFANACCLRAGDILIIENKDDDKKLAISLYAVSNETANRLIQK